MRLPGPDGVFLSFLNTPIFHCCSLQNYSAMNLAQRNPTDGNTQSRKILLVVTTGGYTHAGESLHQTSIIGLRASLTSEHTVRATEGSGGPGVL
jgi:hypothetical protein